MKLVIISVVIFFVVMFVKGIYNIITPDKESDKEDII